MSEETSDKRTSLPVLIPLGLHAKNQPIKLGRPVYVLGAKQHCRIHLVSSTVSNTHAVLVQTRHITYIRDLCSRTHIYVNGDEVKESVLKNGDLLTIGRFQFKYQGPIKDHGAEPAVPPGVLNVAGAETPVPLESRAIVIGRRPTCDVPLLEESVSTIHAVILQWEGQRFIRDLWSRSGTFVNGKAIHEAELKPGDRIKIGETEMTYAPSVDEVAFSLVEGASDSIYADTPAAEEVDFGKEIEPKVTAAQAPLELILTPKSPPPPEELLPLEADETLEATPHDTAHIPLSIEVESTGSKTATPTAVPLGSNFAPTGSKDQPALSSRGWRSSVQDENLPAQDEEPLELEPLAIEIEQDEAPAKPVVPSREVIEPTQPTPESALAMPMAEDSTPQAASGAGELTDTTFGRNVEEFEGESLGPIVESAEPLQVQAVASEPAPVLPGTPSVEEIEPMLMFPVEPAESMAIIDSSAIPVEPAMEPLLEVTPGDETPSLASLAEDVVQPVAEEEPATEIPVLSDSLVPQADAEPEIDLSPMPEKAIDDTPGEEPIAESPLLPLRSPAVEIISPGEVVVEHDDSLEAESAPVSVHVEPAASVSTDLNESLMGQEFGEVEPVRETENVSVPREVLSADVAAPPSDDEAILLEDEIVAEAPEHPIEHEPRLEEISMSPVNVPAHAMVSDPVAVTPDEVEEVMPAPHAEAVVELDTPAIALVPSDVSRVADESFEPVESVATDSISLISDDNNGAPPPVSSGDTGMGMLSAPENEPVLMAQQPAEASPADETVDAAEGMIELSPPENASPVEVEDTIDLSKMTSESVGTPIDDASALDFLTEEAPAEAVTISADSATDGQVTSDHTAADDLGVEAITVTPPEEIPSSPTLESALSNDESGVDLAKLSPKDDADEKIEEPLAIDVAPVETISVSRSDERPLDVEVPEGIPSSPTLESALSRDESGVDLAKLAPKDDAGEKVEEPLAIDVTPMETISVSRSDERPLDVEVPEGIPSSPTLESALARDESSVDLAKFALKDEAGEKIEEPLAVDVTPMETVSVSRSDESPLNIEVPEEIPSSPTLESALGRDESKVDLAKLTPADQIVETVEDAGGDLSAMTGADQSTVPVDESAALDFLTASEPSHEGQATIDESSVEPPPPVVPFPDIKPPVMPAKIAPVSVTPVEIPKLGDVPAVPIMEAPSAEPPADLGFKAIPIPRVGKRGRRGPRARVIRDGFNKGDGASQSGHVEIPPFTEHAAGIAAGESLQGLSQPPVRQADVFSDMAGAAAEVQKDVFSAGSTSEADRLAKEVAKLNADDEFIGKVEAPKRGPEISEKPARASARGVILPGFDLSTPKPAMPVDDPDAAIARRRKLLRRVPVLMTVMILLIGAAWAAAWFLSPMRTRIQATLVFHNFERLTQREQHLTEADQANLLGQEVTRRTAIRML
ncbi:MAG TPA: FHA domain-containing protein, partial [Tepidisphaeraceae bacterium]|nr:FHA domain-containing protein [Tepidisphaeraceae bacterium]